MPTLDPQNPSSWTELSYQELYAIPQAEVEEAQRQAMVLRFDQLRDRVDSLRKLAERQGVERVETFDDVLPVLFDHRVFKSYPLSIIEKRQFAKLTAWLDRLTTHDLSKIDVSDVTTVDGWLDRMDANGMIIGHSTGTTGKLSFIPRSQTEWPAWHNAWHEAMAATTGTDRRKEKVIQLSTNYRTGHQMMMKMSRLMSESGAGGEEYRHCLYDYGISSDLLSLAGRLQAAEEQGTVDELEIDPALLEGRKEFIERARHRDHDLEVWFDKLANRFRGQKVVVGGTSADLVRIMLQARAKGITCDFGDGSVLMAGGGMKGYKDAPPDWEDQIKAFFNADRLCSMYGMSEVIGNAPKCANGYFHFLPYLVPMVLDEQARQLPREGVQTGRMALFDPLVETSWGGFISGDKVTMHWDDDCGCGWHAPRIESNIIRFAEEEGGDDKITCAGTAQAYSEFMDYVSQV